jgi:cation diffusion facilitator family transporter
MAHSHGPHDAHDHDHGHSHGDRHDHAHDHGPTESAPAARATTVVHGQFTEREAKQARRLRMVLSLVGGFFVLELTGAILADSVVLQADALHLLMDVLALSVSLVAMRLAVRRPTPRFTYGLRRAEPVAAIFSAGLVLATTGGILFEGIEALHGHSEPRVSIMLVVATLALFVNGLSAWLLHDSMHAHDHGHAHAHAHDADNPDDHDRAHPGHDDHDADAGAGARKPAKAGGHTLNLRGAWLHLLGDALGAVAAIVAAVVIRFGGPAAADPIASFVVAAILLAGSLRLLRDALLVLLEASPPHMPVATIRGIIAGFPGVTAIHDLHVWTLGAGHDAITAHVCTESRDPLFGRHLSDAIRDALEVEYVTVQVEVGDAPCGAPPSVIG